MVRASAGTGKTYQLTGRLLRLLAGGAAAESVLATTFTRKAAGEILTRVLLTPARAACDPSGEKLEELRRQSGLPELTAGDAAELAHRLLRDIHRMKVLTLDSLFSQLARSFGFELGLPPGWRLTDEIEDEWIRERAVDVMLAGLSTEETVTLLSMLGKGDTKRSVRREMLAVVADGYAEARACAAEAWQSLSVPTMPGEELLAEACETLADIKIGHKSADKYLQLFGATAAARRWEDAAGNTLAMLVRTASAETELMYYKKPIPSHAAQAMQAIVDACESHVLGLLRMQTEATGRVIGEYEQQLMAMKRALRAFGFDDIAHRLACEVASLARESAAHRLDGNIEHVLLDEFQDTSPAQWGVLKPFADASVSSETGGSFFCVGDVKQAIYGWRGGVAGIFDSVARYLPGIREQQQNISYRSSPVVLDAVNQIFRHLNRHPDFPATSQPAAGSCDRSEYEAWAVTSFAALFPKHESAKKDLSGHVRLISSPAPPDETAGRGAKGAKGDTQENSETRRIRHLHYVARQVAEWTQQMPGRSFGILTRTNRSVAQLIYLLRRGGVDVSQEGGNPLTDSPAVELVLSALMAAEHPGDGRWYFHIAHSPLAGLLQIPSNSSPTGPQAYRTAAQIRRIVEDEGIAAAVESFADALAPICDDEDLVRLRQLISLAWTYEPRRSERLRDFVALVRSKRVEKPRPAQVRVMTVHQAKGLEFDVVVLPELDQTLTRQSRRTIAMKQAIDAVPEAMLRYVGTKYWPYLPQRWQRCFGEHAAGLMTESLCLLYVAITRPRRALYMIVQPANKPEFKNKTAAALLYHSLGCTADPTQGEQVLFESGDPLWHQDAN